MESIVVAALYQFKAVADPANLQQSLKDLCKTQEILGTLIVANEGINGTVSGSRQAIDVLHQFLLAQGFDRMEYKESFAPEHTFRKLKIKLKKEIVTLGVHVDPRDHVGTYLEPEQWHEFIQQDDVIIIDTRNDYEYVTGTFEGAIDPQTKSFGEFPQYVQEHLKDAKDKKIAMFCTGGIRCEKSTSYLLQEGFKEVYHLKGGILNYLAHIPNEQSLWKGECFVFDRRVGVGHGVNLGDTAMCFGCGHPLFAGDTDSPKYEEGVSCPHCYDHTTEEQKARFRMRQSQHVLKRMVKE
ncbi:MAG TPA: rhodanese-related sulfurtransferase [Agitococcus sp.]|nr:rhodanese-related sulfurtransferase [Agitococcus sp.]HMY82236.1 rhodanese-related sulfurtransferase [Agitococcus sp.]HNB20008.1 rhodanese-related sulfurtransferase [Agitococcus sp.]HNH43781.1 rhodanese-related sulfurtransferase [Agitococcus sp.]HNJ87106.1 rhodanese-related sulfurtransferase [Agitococcus sp.]